MRAAQIDTPLETAFGCSGRPQQNPGGDIALHFLPLWPSI